MYSIFTDISILLSFNIKITLHALQYDVCMFFYNAICEQFVKCLYSIVTGILKIL